MKYYNINIMKTLQYFNLFFVASEKILQTNNINVYFSIPAIYY